MNRITKGAAIGIGSAALLLGAAAPALAGNGASNAHFSATYVEPSTAGPVTFTCAGEHIDNNGVGIRDEEDCALSGPGTASYVPGIYSGSPSGTFPGLSGSDWFWLSDYNGREATSYMITVNGSSTRAHIEATYAS